MDQVDKQVLEAHRHQVEPSSRTIRLKELRLTPGLPLADSSGRYLTVSPSLHS